MRMKNYKKLNDQQKKINTGRLRVGSKEIIDDRSKADCFKDIFSTIWVKIKESIYKLVSLHHIPQQLFNEKEVSPPIY